MKRRSLVKDTNESNTRPSRNYQQNDDEEATEQDTLLSSSLSLPVRSSKNSVRKNVEGEASGEQRTANSGISNERQSLLQRRRSTANGQLRKSSHLPETTSYNEHSLLTSHNENEEEGETPSNNRTNSGRSTASLMTTDDASGDSDDQRTEDDVELLINRPRVGGKVSRACDAHYDACLVRCQWLCPLVYRILRSPPERYRTTKLAFGMPIGFAFGLVYYHVIIDRMHLGSNYLRYMLGTVMTFGLAAGYGMSVHVRALTWLVIPNMFGRGGRTVLLTLAVGALINGPIAHIVANLKESVRSVTCSAEVTMELAKKRFELMSKPIHEVLKDFAEQSLKLHNISERIHEAFAPMETEVSGQRETQQLEQKFKRIDSEVGIDRTKLIEDKTKVDEPKPAPAPSSAVASTNDVALQTSPANKKSRGTFLQMMYQRKLDLRCGDIFNSAIDACKAELGRAYRDCMGHLNIIGFLFCWPCKLGVLCNVIKLLPNPIDCDAAKVMQTDFGDAFAEAERADTMLEDAFEVRVEYKIERRNPQPMIDQRTPTDSIRSMNTEFEEKEQDFNFWTILFQRVLAFLFIRVFISSNDYLKSYTLDIRHDNCYMTNYFRKIEQRRIIGGRSTLLPLKRLERHEIIEPLSVRLLPQERKKVVSGTVFIAMQAVSCLVVFAFDRLLYDMLDLIARHTRVEFRQRGTHHISLNVTGDGAVAQMVRTIFTGFSKTHSIDQRINNDRCLPYPVRSGWLDYLKVYGTLLAMWWLLLSEAYGMRLRHIIAAFFFRRRSKARTLNLYNGLVKRRKTYAMFLRHQVRREAHRRELLLERATSIAQTFQAMYPKLCALLARFGFDAAQPKCLACKTTLRNADDKNECKITPNCPGIYCDECWDILEQHCYYCQPQKPAVKKMGDDSDDDEGFDDDVNLAPSGDSEGDEADN